MTNIHATVTNIPFLLVRQVLNYATQFLVPCPVGSLAFLRTVMYRLMTRTLFQRQAFPATINTNMGPFYVVSATPCPTVAASSRFPDLELWLHPYDILVQSGHLNHCGSSGHRNLGLPFDTLCRHVSFGFEMDVWVDPFLTQGHSGNLQLL